MSDRFQKITPFLWFDHQAEEAAKFYTTIFNDAGITNTTYYSADSASASGRPKNSIMTVAFELAGQEFVALNGGPQFNFTEAISFIINCDSQDEVDYYWNRLTEGGDEKAQQCGWLKDKYGVSWQVVPRELAQLLNESDAEKSQRVMAALLQMKKIDLHLLKQASAGQ